MATSKSKATPATKAPQVKRPPIGDITRQMGDLDGIGALIDGALTARDPASSRRLVAMACGLAKDMGRAELGHMLRLTLDTDQLVNTEMLAQAQRAVEHELAKLDEASIAA